MSEIESNFFYSRLINDYATFVQSYCETDFYEEESKEILEYLKEKAYVYHTPYKRYNKMVKVPRGQASFTLNENIHYNY